MTERRGRDCIRNAGRTPRRQTDRQGVGYPAGAGRRKERGRGADLGIFFVLSPAVQRASRAEKDAGSL